MAKRFVSGAVTALFMSGAGMADAPAELPPGDFPGAQYIDSKGCVFLRDGQGGWVPRLYQGEVPTCGYPPTLSARRLSPDQQGLIPSGRQEPARARQIEQAVAEAVISNLRTGELVSDPAPFQPLPDMGPERASRKPADMLKAEVEAQAVIRQGMAASLRPNYDLCRLLGHDGTAPRQDARRPGSDPTRGFCGDLPPLEVARLPFIRPVEVGPPKIATALAPPERARKSQPAALTSGAARPKLPTLAKVSDRQVSGTPAPAPVRKVKADDVPVIPAGARYLQVGVFADKAGADAATRKLHGLGLGAVRQRPPKNTKPEDLRHVIMAGPFDTRKKIVTAYYQLTEAGFTRVQPR